MKRKVGAVILAVGAATIFARPADAARPKDARPTGSITVSAAASLTDAFTEMGTDFERRNKNTTITFNFGASSVLAQQIQGGAPADVFASADGANMQKLVSGGDVTTDPVDFASNALNIVVKPGNPRGVRSIGDLSDVDVVSLCAPTVPCGKYAEQVLSQSGVTIFPRKVTVGHDVKGALGAVATGDADAGIVYVTDAIAAGKTVERVRIPASLNVLAVYPIARLAPSANASLAKAWVRYVTSSAGQRMLRSFGFLPPPPVA